MARKDRERDIDQSPWTRPGFVLAGLVVVLALACGLYLAIGGGGHHATASSSSGRPTTAVPTTRSSTGRSTSPTKRAGRRLQRPARASGCADHGPDGHRVAASGALPCAAMFSDRGTDSRARRCRPLLRPLAARCADRRRPDPLPDGAAIDVNGVAVHRLRPDGAERWPDQLATMTEAGGNSQPGRVRGTYAPPGRLRPDRRVQPSSPTTARRLSSTLWSPSRSALCGGSPVHRLVGGRRLEARRHTQRRPHRACTGDQLDGRVHRLERRMSAPG